MKRKKMIIIGAAAGILFFLAISAVVFAENFLAGETAIRDSWEIETGNYLLSDEALNVSVYEADCESDVEIKRIVPDESGEEGFTYYDTDVQQRLAAALVNMGQEQEYTLENPLYYSDRRKWGRGLHDRCL